MKVSDETLACYSTSGKGCASKNEEQKKGILNWTEKLTQKCAMEKVNKYNDTTIGLCQYKIVIVPSTESGEEICLQVFYFFNSFFHAKSGPTNNHQISMCPEKPV